MDLVQVNEPRQERKSGCVEHPVGEHRGPNGAMNNHDDTEQKTDHARHRSHDEPERKMKQAEDNRDERDSRDSAIAISKFAWPKRAHAGQRAGTP